MSLSSSVLSQEYKLWPSRGLLVLLLIMAHYLPNALTQFQGFTDIRFESEPQSVYTTTSLNIAVFDCRALGMNTMTGQEELLDTRFLLNNQTLLSKFFPPTGHEYHIDGDDDYVVGLIVSPVSESFNGNQYKCQVYIDGTAVNVISRTATLTVGDGQPPAIPITFLSSGLYTISVSWSSPMLPSNGPILSYFAEVFTTSNDLVYSRNVTATSLLQYTFPDLTPATSYRLSITARNVYGIGDKVTQLLEASTQSPSVTDSPSGISFAVVPGNGNIIASVEPPSAIDDETMTPITEYRLVYHQSGQSPPSEPVVIPASNPHFHLYGLTVGVTYTFSVSAVNSAGASNPLTVEYAILPYTGTQTITPPTTSTTQQLTHSPSPSTTTTTSTSVTSDTTASTIITGSQTVVVTVVPHTTAPPSQPSPSTTSTTVTTITNAPPPPPPSFNTASTSDQHRTTLTSSTSSSSSSSSSSFSSSSSSTLVAITSTPSSHKTTTAPSSTTTTPATSNESTGDPDADQSNNNNSDSAGLPINAVVLAIGVVALVILIAIIVVSVLLVIFFCVRRKEESQDLTDYGPTHWPINKPSEKTWGESKDSSIKGSSISGSISDDTELPNIEGHSQGSPPSIRGNIRDDDVKIEDSRRQTINAEVNGRLQTQTRV